MMKTPLLAAVLLALSTSAASAQALLQPNQAVTGRVEQGQTACFLLPTRAGSQWRVDLSGTMDTYLELGRGTCAAMTVDKSNDDVATLLFQLNSRIDFASGGGAYVVRVQGLGGAAGNYTVTARTRPGMASNGLLPAAAAAGPWLTAGWTPESVSAFPALSGEGLRAGNVFKDCDDVCPEMVVVPAGGFTMGSPAEEAGRTANEGPRHAVALVNPFAVGRYEVTFAEFDACVADGACSYRPNDQGWGRGRRPVVDVSWNDAQAYVLWLSDKTGNRYTLPSEAEWEYVARAGADTPWQTGRAILTDDANILNAFARTVNVGGYPPNRFGLHDVHGNVSEWTLDCMDTGYIGVPNDGSAASAGNCAAARLVRGGAFINEPAHVRFAQRTTAAQDARFTGVGFRVARAL
ncbi:MAG: formylglycine-generating enzyme family protein [Pseudomonadota bacterium]